MSGTLLSCETQAEPHNSLKKVGKTALWSMSTDVQRRHHWRKEDHLDDPVAIVASLAQTGQTSIADDDLVVAVNAMDSAIRGFQRRQLSLVQDLEASLKERFLNTVADADAADEPLLFPGETQEDNKQCTACFVA